MKNRVSNLFSIYSENLFYYQDNLNIFKEITGNNL